MKIGLIGLGKMGYNLALNFQSKNISLSVYDHLPAPGEELAKLGIENCRSLEEFALSLPEQKIIWMMIPAGAAVEETISLLEPFLDRGDILIDGGNSHYKDSVRRAASLAEKGIYFLDCGSSGGTSGAREGLCTMLGGDRKAFEIIEPYLRNVSLPGGYLYCGAAGSGHFAKMVHNGIEYGMMQSIAEGFEMMEKSGYGTDHEALAKLWNNGSVIRSWLIELCAGIFKTDPSLDSLRGVIHSSGEGKWMVETALERNIPTPVIALSLMMRYRSQEENTFSAKLVAALRNAFGGHAIEPNKKDL